MDKYYLLTQSLTKGISIAWTPDIHQISHELIPVLDGVNELPYELNLKSAALRKGDIVLNDNLVGLRYIWVDLQPNNLAWYLISERFKEVIENHLTGEEDIDWIKAKVNGNNESRIYYILRFNKMHDVLDYDKSLFNSGSGWLIKPCFSLNKIKHYTIFGMPSKYDLWKIPSSVFVSERLKKAIKIAKLVGIGFEETFVSHLSRLTSHSS